MADRTRRKPAANPPITSHPLFPVTVILWFGALFGLASLAIRPALIEHVVLAANIDRVIPMAAPPLGTTTRILLALMMTGIGCVLGAVIARALAKPQPHVAARRRRAAAEAESPVAMFGASEISHGEEREDETTSTRRRQLTAAPVAEPENVADEAPLPGVSPIFDVAELELDSFDAALDEGPWMRRPVELPAEAAIDHEAQEEPEPAERIVFGRRQIVEPADEPKRANRLFDAYVHAPRALGDPDVPSPGFELIPSAESLEVSSPDSEPVAEPHQPEISMDEPPTPEQEAEPARAPSAAERIASAPLDELSPVELLERLALTIARRRAMAARQQAEPEPTPEVPGPAVTPVALRPVPLDSVAEDDDALPGYVPPRHISLAPVPQDGADAGTDADALAAGYASLRDLSKGDRPQFGRKDDATSVVSFPESSEAPAATPEATARSFDAPASAATDQTEQALRAALATLQRMSGAA